MPAFASEVDHVGDRFFIHTNLDAPDYRLMTAADATPDAAHWSEIVPEAPGRHLPAASTKPSKRSWPPTLRMRRGMTIRLFSLPEGREIPLPRPAEVGVASSYFEDSNSANLDASSKVLRFHFSGPLDLPSVYDFDTADGTFLTPAQARRRKPLVRSEWLCARSPQRRRSRRRACPGHARLSQGAAPARRQSGPAESRSYGAMAASFRPTFTAHAFSLVDRGCLR